MMKKPREPMIAVAPARRRTGSTIDGQAIRGLCRDCRQAKKVNGSISLDDAALIAVGAD
jgi:hypothetical protein